MLRLSIRFALTPDATLVALPRTRGPVVPSFSGYIIASS